MLIQATKLVDKKQIEVGIVIAYIVLVPYLSLGYT